MSELATRVKEHEVVKDDPAKKTVLHLIHDQQKAIQLALPQHMTAERFTRIVLTEVRRTPQLLGCDPMSLLGSVMLAAQLGLEPGPLGHCYFLPFGREVTFIIGYKGMIDLARRSGQISTISARAVFAGDTFSYRYGLNDDLQHIPARDTGLDPEKLTHVYAVAKFKDGGHQFVVLTRSDVESYMKRSPSAKAKQSPWKSDFVAMALKTAVRRLFPFLPISPEVSQAFTYADEAPVHGVSVDILSDLALSMPDDEDIEDAEVVKETEEEAEVVEPEPAA